MTKMANRAEGRRAAMRAAGLLFGAIFGALMVSEPAVACEDAQFEFNIPMEVQPDCSFSAADTKPSRRWRDDLRGEKAHDRGNGRVAQRLYVGGYCYLTEVLVFTECETGQSIEIFGVNNEDQSLAPFARDYIKLIQPPHGPIRADNDDTVESLADQAAKAGYKYVVRGTEKTNQESWIMYDGGYWTRYKSNCGCKLFYPDSKAASARWARTGK